MAIIIHQSFLSIAYVRHAKQIPIAEMHFSVGDVVQNLQVVMEMLLLIQNHLLYENFYAFLRLKAVKVEK